jgi:phosphatidate cytidylyltransferase
VLSQRVLSAAVMIPLVALVIYLGGWWIFLVMAAAIIAAQYEFWQVLSVGGHRPSLPVAVAISLALLVDAQWPALRLTVPTVTAALLVSLIWHLVDYELGAPASATDWGLTLGGGLYLGWMAGLLSRLRELPGGLGWIMLAFIPVWIGDSAAFFVGLRWGTHKSFPRLSPKKSWEGTAAGVAATTLCLMILGVPLGLSLWQALALGVTVAVLAPLGDLAESMFKRQVGVKDSGHLIPGHGGVLDRIDSMLFSVPAVYFFILLTRG